ICAMAPLMAASTSLVGAMAPWVICRTNSATRPVACARCSSSRTRMPRSRIESSRLTSVAAAAAAPAFSVAGLLIGSLRCVGLAFADAHLVLKLREVSGVGEPLAQQLIEPVVAVELALQVGEALPRIEQLPHRLDLVHHLFGFEVGEVAELE